MAEPDLTKLNPGDILDGIPSGTWNTFVDIANLVKRNQVLVAPGQRSIPLGLGGIITVKNSSGADRERFDVLGFSDSVIASEDNLEHFKNQAVLTGVTPTPTHFGRYCILLAPILNEEFGQAVVSGLAIARVNVILDTHRAADIAVGDATQLESRASGSATILFKDAGTGTQWAVVRIGNADSDVPGGEGSSSGCQCCDPFNCNDPGQDISSDCPICECSCEPLVIKPGDISCGTADVGGPRALFLDPDNSSTDVCTWSSDEFESDSRTFIWSMAVLSDSTATLVVEETTDPDNPVILGGWACDTFCCQCENQFDASCPPYIPIPCDGFPRTICVKCPTFGNPDSGVPGCATDFGFDCTSWPGDGGGWNMTISGPTDAIGGDTVCSRITGTIFLAADYDTPAPCSGAFRGDSAVASHFIADADFGSGGKVTVTISVTSTVADPDCGETATYTMLVEDWVCDGPNTLTKESVAIFTGSCTNVCNDWPATISLEVAENVLVDSSGAPILDGAGNTISPSAYPDCSAPSSDCMTGQCIYQSRFVGSSWTWVLLGGSGCAFGDCNCDDAALPGAAVDHKGETVTVGCAVIP